MRFLFFIACRGMMFLTKSDRYFFTLKNYDKLVKSIRNGVPAIFNRIYGKHDLHRRKVDE